jgi:hypothetical protein
LLKGHQGFYAFSKDFNVKSNSNVRLKQNMCYIVVFQIPSLNTDGFEDETMVFEPMITCNSLYDVYIHSHGNTFYGQTHKQEVEIGFV